MEHHRSSPQSRFSPDDIVRILRTGRKGWAHRLWVRHKYGLTSDEWRELDAEAERAERDHFALFDRPFPVEPTQAATLTSGPPLVTAETSVIQKPAIEIVLRRAPIEGAGVRFIMLPGAEEREDAPITLSDRTPPERGISPVPLRSDWDGLGALLDQLPLLGSRGGLDGMEGDESTDEFRKSPQKECESARRFPTLRTPLHLRVDPPDPVTIEVFTIQDEFSSRPTQLATYIAKLAKLVTIQDELSRPVFKLDVMTSPGTERDLTAKAKIGGEFPTSVSGDVISAISPVQAHASTLASVAADVESLFVQDDDAARQSTSGRDALVLLGAIRSKLAATLEILARDPELSDEAIEREISFYVLQTLSRTDTPGIQPSARWFLRRDIDVHKGAVASRSVPRPSDVFVDQAWKVCSGSVIAATQTWTAKIAEALLTSELPRKPARRPDARRTTPDAIRLVLGATLVRGRFLLGVDAASKIVVGGRLNFEDMLDLVNARARCHRFVRARGEEEERPGRRAVVHEGAKLFYWHEHVPLDERVRLRYEASSVEERLDLMLRLVQFAEQQWTSSLDLEELYARQLGNLYDTLLPETGRPPSRVASRANRLAAGPTRRLPQDVITVANRYLLLHVSDALGFEDTGTIIETAGRRWWRVAVVNTVTREPRGSLDVADDGGDVTWQPNDV